jgi:pyruvate formate lyase activating enzyme
MCGACVAACPAKATTLSGTEYTVDQLIGAVMKDRKFFETFEGGVTASGGEPTSQAAFVYEFFKGLKAAGIHTALDTCGLTAGASLERLLPLTDCVLFDLKFIDSGMHRDHTGQPNAAILANLARVVEFARANRGLALWIRTPLIPGASASAENVSAIGRFIRSDVLDVLDRWELCAFNSLCREKYQKLNLAWEYEGVGLLSHAAAEDLLGAAREYVPADMVAVTGILAE